jgi:RimJ/RimL family protein N-acetyltransferase
MSPHQTGATFTRTDPLGTFALRPADPVADAPLVHRWVTHPKAAFWQLLDATVTEVTKEIEQYDSYLGLHNGAPAFFMERYDPARELAGVYPAQPGDVGMHFLVAPTDTPIHGFTRAVIVTVMAALFADPATRRVVVEPDLRNTAVHTLNAYVGFQVLGPVTLPGKRALLSVCTREDYRTAMGGHRDQ